MLTVQADLLLATTPQPMMLTEEDASRYLTPEPYCESDSADMVTLAQQLKTDTERETVRKIFQWVTSNVQYAGYIKNPRGAAYALTHGKGDCTEYMYLFVALCRAAGIPARGLGGYVVDRNAMLRPQAYHNWAEFYLNGVWHVADPQKQIFMDNQAHYLAMRVIGDTPDDHPMQGYQRFRYAGEGLRVGMN
jgi:transglutaminase-like putative cysteine protease